MTDILNFLTAHSDKLWAFFSTILGAVITYMVTTSSEKRKEKRESNLQRLKDVLIPYCTSIETVIDLSDEEKRYKVLDVNATETEDEVSASALKLEKLRNFLDTPLSFLKAEKRVFMTEKQREDLYNYEAMLKNFYKEWNKEQALIISSYEQWLSTQLSSFPEMSCVPSCGIEIGFSEERKLKDDLRLSLVFKEEVVPWKNHINSLTFINDDVHGIADTVSINEKVREADARIEAGVDEPDSFDPDTLRGVDLLNYISKIQDNKRKELIAGSKTNNAFNLLMDKARDIKDQLDKDIDKIAG